MFQYFDLYFFARKPHRSSVLRAILDLLLFILVGLYYFSIAITFLVDSNIAYIMTQLKGCTT